MSQNDSEVRDTPSMTFSKMNKQTKVIVHIYNRSLFSLTFTSRSDSGKMLKIHN